jgi:hypothetical protein
MIEIPIEDALEVSRHNEPQVGPQEWECGCVTEVFVTDRDYREDEKPFEMRLTKWCETDCQPWGMAQAGRVYQGMRPLRAPSQRRGAAASHLQQS